MKYQNALKAARIKRANRLILLAAKGRTMDEVGKMQNPPISRQRVFALIKSVRK